MPKLNQKGIIHVPILLAAIGLIVFIFISASGDFKDKLFGTLFPAKPSSYAVSGPISGAVNLAVGKTAVQSSTIDPRWPASNAIDDNTQNFSHTNIERNSFVTVDLGAVYNLSQIQVFNRGEIPGQPAPYAERLSNYYVFVSDNEFTSTNPDTTSAQTGVSSFRNEGQAQYPSTVDVNKTGRYVRLQLAGTDYLTPAEIKVLGTPVSGSTPPTTSGTNIAPGKQVSQSTTVDPRWPASNAIDNNDQTFSHTNYQSNPWVTINLGEVYNISRIEVWNRGEIPGQPAPYPQRLSNYYVFVSDNEFTSTNPDTTSAQSGVSTFLNSGQAQRPSTINTNITGKYVRLQLRGSDYLTPAEIKVFGTLASGSASASISVSPTTLQSDGTLNVTWSGIANPNLGDYINITTADDKNGVTSHTYWINNNCSWFTPSSGTPKSSGSCTISLKNDPINTVVPGPYHLVLYSGATPGITTILARSTNFDLIKRVFITSTTYNGNLVRPDFPLTGLSGADDKCNDRAYTAKLGGNWKAWLSDSTTSAASRLTHNSGPYKLLNGTTVANNWADLTDGTLQNPINLTELNTIPSYMSCVWTSTNMDGNYLPAQANVTGCNDYKNANSDYSWCGRNGSSDSNWTKWSTDRCDQVHPLYCFEQ